MATTTKKTTTSTKKVTKPKANVKKTLDKTNKKVITQKTIVNRELKYIYPRGCKDTVSRKAYRQTIRNKIRKFERNIADLKGQAKKDMVAELKVYKAEHLA